MTGLEKAKQFLKEKVGRTALVVLPLAVATVQAHAGVIVLGSGSFNASGFGASVSNPTPSNQSIPDNGSGVTGLKFYGDVTFTAYSGSSFAYISGHVTPGSCVYICGGLTANGTFDPSSYPNDVLVFNYKFSVSDNNGDTIYWSFNADAFGSSFTSQTNSGSVASNSTVSGSIALGGLSGANITGWSTNREIDFGSDYSAGDSLTLSIPQNSVDILGQAGTPEPSTFGLLGIGSAALLWLRRRFKS